MKKINLFFLSTLLITVSCVTTVDVERKVRAQAGIGRQEDPASFITAVPVDRGIPEPLVIEKPVFVPEREFLPDAPQGRAAVLESNALGIVQPEDYSNAVMLYDYDRDFVYELYCQPFRISDVVLQPGEQAVEPPFVSDSERWQLGAGVSYEAGVPVQHIYVKPSAAGLEASLIINTDLRTYHLILRSFSNVHMPVVRWRYHETDLPQNFVKPPATAAPGTAYTGGFEDAGAYYADPRFLSFNYRIIHAIFRKPRWLPELVYDDGKKTYIVFPAAALTAELPAVFENRDDVVNYRVLQNIVIIDKLIEEITVKLGSGIAVIQKKRGK